MNWIKENKEKIWDKTNAIIEFIIALILAISIFKIQTNYIKFGDISKVSLIITTISCILLLGIIICNFKKYKKEIAKLFVTCIIPIGMMYAILLPIGQVPDEEAHLFRTYDFSCGNFITPLGDENKGEIFIPEQMLELSKSWDKFQACRKLIQEKSDYTKLVSVDTITKTYFPINYLTGAISFFVGRIFNVNIILMCYIIRLINFALFILVGYYSIKIIPFGKLVLSIYMFLPMIIQQACSLSADAFINMIAILFIAYNLKLLYQENNLTLKQRIIYYTLALSLSVCKYVYFPLTFMSLLLIKNKNINKKEKCKIITISTITSVIAAIGWFIFSQKYVDLREHIRIMDIQPIEQLKLIIKNPLQYVNIFRRSLEVSGYEYLFGFTGNALGLLEINIPDVYIVPMTFGLFITPFFEENKKSLEILQKIILVMIAIILIVLILTGLYLTWSPVGANLISGVQGRYFIPVYILFLLAMCCKENNIKVKNIERKYFIIYLLLNIISIIKILMYFAQ